MEWVSFPWALTQGHSIPIPVSRRGGRNKGGRKQMRANANKRRQTLTNASKREQTRANASKRGQTQTNAYTPLICGFGHPPLQSPYCRICVCQILQGIALYPLKRSLSQRRLSDDCSKQGHSCTRVRGPPVALHVSRYTCRSKFPQNPGVFQV